MKTLNEPDFSANHIVEKIELFRCEECGAEYEDYDEARECCPPTISEVEYWVCSECGEYCKTEVQAIEHCTDQSYRTKLESQGQIRLFP
ncbi:hypothetical protein BI364_10145 [Acidihalobacter yilgarnensis]|uniref:Uncharacterized protein n=1 Tax=Acidihalobacter yilgarnensis TaxID=2819280 RepID=A0A1D8IP97_9GAMM|nr:hypothetical protein [Acidihalobacter yilgarnensis]AOU98273.1 hypothetical protein BI364_10145 [Acidihalobacter yilgarnensis]